MHQAVVVQFDLFNVIVKLNFEPFLFISVTITTARESKNRLSDPTACPDTQFENQPAEGARLKLVNPMENNQI